MTVPAVARSACGLTADQQAAVGGMLAAFNASCSVTEVLNATCASHSGM
jgi:hypothetical protein